MKKEIRCAIYTRKSSEEGLEQGFNSLDAQREACEAYIKSQVHEGWVLIEKQYNDGGFSGGTMNRPAFKELMEDIKQDKIDIIVVYKVDRLTRSIMDFAKIIEVFDSHETSFVSITQHFNTTTSMGRLTLNILLSFAQFEREVTGERIRDKFEATRQKGLWINGVAPYGYTKNENFVLIPEAPYDKNIQEMFDKYLELGTVEKLRNYLAENKIYSRSEKEFSRGNIYKILSNKVYIGKLQHKDKVYEGKHEPLVDEDKFNKVQELLQENSAVQKHTLYAKEGSLLMGLLYDDAGNRMSPSHSNKKGIRYRYYITKTENLKGRRTFGKITKLAAGEIEGFVQKSLNELIRNKKTIQPYFDGETIEIQHKIFNFIEKFIPDKVFIRNSITRIDLAPETVTINYNISYISEYFKSLINNTKIREFLNGTQVLTHKYDVRISITPKRQNKLMVNGENNTDTKLVNAIIKSFWYNQVGAEGLMTPEIRNGGCKKLKKVRFLPPEIIESILNGTQDPELNITKLIEMAEKAA